MSAQGLDWRYELGLNGFRAIGRKSGRSAQLWSGNQENFPRSFPNVVKGIAGLPKHTLIDAEIVARDEYGRPSFNPLQGFGKAQVLEAYSPSHGKCLRGCSAGITQGLFWHSGR
jgi:ATP-dependent DNA ligase